MSYYTDFIIKFPTFALCLKPGHDMGEEYERDRACLEVMQVLVRDLQPLLEDTMWTELPRVTQEQVYAVLHGLPWSRPEEVQLIFREEADPLYRFTTEHRLDIAQAVGELVEFVDPKSLAELLKIKDPSVAGWVSKYVVPYLPA